MRKILEFNFRNSSASYSIYQTGGISSTYRASLLCVDSQIHEYLFTVVLINTDIYSLVIRIALRHALRVDEKQKFIYERTESSEDLLSSQSRGMMEYIYNEEDYICKEALAEYAKYLSVFNNAPWEIELEDDFLNALAYLSSINSHYPKFLVVYEDILLMIERLPSEIELVLAEAELRENWMKFSLQIAHEENIFNKYVSWEELDNRPLFRGLFECALHYWKTEQYNLALQLFENIYNLNSKDPMGTRFAIKAMKEELSCDQFIERFIERRKWITNFKLEALLRWYRKEG